jgi:YD repeat-containing protein
VNAFVHRCTAVTVAAILILPQFSAPSGAAVRPPAIAAPARGAVMAVAAGHTPPARIAIPEPARRTPMPWPRVLPSSAQHAAVPGMQHATARGTARAGVPAAGPPMLRPTEVDRVLKAAREHARQRGAHLASEAQPVPVVGPVTGRAASPGSARGHGAPAGGATRTTHSLPSSSGTGINPWWRYQEENVPGGGRVMTNVGTGNLVLQDDDMNVAHKGVAVAFRRTYNSQSLHDVNGRDASVPSMYGNGWTNTFDAHLSGSRTGTITVWDIDGARYDYTVAADGVTYVAPAGQHATLVTDGASGYLWTKKSGTTYYFWAPDAAVSWPSSLYQQYGAYAGRLYQIIGRNRNTFITFNYGWNNGNSAAGGTVGTIAAQTESGLTATLLFDNVSGHPLLSSITFPDGATTVSYGYDASGNLINVSRPPNNAAGTRVSHSYGYQTLGTDTVMYWADSPRWESCAAGCGNDGAWLQFQFTGTSASSSALSAISHGGVINLTIADGSSSPTLQSGYPTTAVWYSTEFFSTGVPTPTFRDSDGHAMNWAVDSLGRPTQTQECTATASGSCTGTWLVTNETWDASNELASQVDPRGNETDYQYDLMGNETAVGAPYVTTSQGSFRPTKLYDYDTFNNVVAFCDEVETHQAGADWTPGSGSISPNESPCASRAGSVPYWRATYAYPSYEAHGELSSMTTPLGYTRTFSYAPAQQAGADYGLPTAVTGAAIAQLDGSTITPAQTFWYDGTGNLRCYSKGQGAHVLSYDALGRLVSEADPDDSSANASSLCGKSTGQPGWNTQTTTTYFADGSKASTQTPSERAFGVSTTYAYDLDGNVVTETQHHGCAPNHACLAGVTRKWYDGADRLVEVAQPHDTRMLSNPIGYYDGDPWLTRYLYDLSAGGTVSVSGSTSSRAYGNLFDTQTSLSDTGWTDVRGSAFDAADRETSKFSYKPGMYAVSYPLETATLQYDLDSTSLGLLAKKTNPSGESVTYAYDAHGRIGNESYAGDAGRTAGEAYVYDPNGRKASITSSQFGVQQYQYDADGRLTTSVEPNGGGLTSPAQISYSYYANGQRSAVSVASSGLTQSNVLTYSYRADGALRAQSVTAFANGTWWNQYTDAGRLTGVGGIDTQSRAYDPAGQLANYTVSAGTATFTHDPEGSALTEYLPNVMRPGAGAAVPETTINTLNVRGELVDSVGGRQSHRRTTTNSGCSSTSTIPDDLSQYDASNDSTVSPGTCDRVNGISIAADTSIQSTLYDGQSYPSGTRNSESFDGTGRIVQTVHTAYGFAQRNGSQAHVPAHGSGDPGAADAGAATAGGPSDTVSSFTKTTSVRAYDVENHLRTVQTTLQSTGPSKTNVATTGPSTTIGWGPNGHPVSIVVNYPGGTMTNETLHWDGDTILFVTDGAGNVTDFKVGLDGDVTPRDGTFGGLSVYDRDPAGVIVQTSNATGSTGFNPLDPSTVSGAGAAGTTGYRAANVPEQYVRGDGFMVAGVQINGVRAYDPNLGAWTTPDAYEGEVHDPVSQQRYMWNRGNAVDFNDPSGYDVLIMVDPRSVAPFGHMSMVIYNPQTMAGTRYESGPVEAGKIAHTKEKITITPINDVRQLGAYNQDTYHHASTTAQDNKMKKYWNDTKVSADSGKDLYNAVTNSCSDKVFGALEAAEMNPFAFAKIPTLEGRLLSGTWQQQAPQDLKPNPRSP